MKEFAIEENDELLIIRLSSIAGSGRLIIELAVMMISFVILFSFPYSKVVDISPFLVAIYFLPLLRIRKLLEAVKDFFGGKTYTFDKAANTLSINNKEVCNMSDISSLQIKEVDNEEGAMLYLFRLRDPFIKLSSSGNINEYKKVGRAVAKVAKVEFWDKRKFHDELLWGSTQSSSSDISVLNNHHGDYS